MLGQTVTPNTPILTLGKYQLVHRSNDDYIRFEQNENNTSALFSFLRMFVCLRIVISCFSLTGLIALSLGVPTFFIFIGLFCLMVMIIFGTRRFFALFKIINTKTTTLINTTPTIHKAEWLWVSSLAILGFVQIFLNLSGNNTVTLDYSIDIALSIFGIPYFIYQLRNLLLK